MPTDFQFFPHPSRPKLLVSVRNAREVTAALAGGCEIVDVKEPNRGSLGMADLAEVARVFAAVDERMPVSAALGEVVDWMELDNIPTLPFGLNYVKLGMSNLGSGSTGIRRWLEVRRTFSERVEATLNWVAVCYADWEAAGAPQPQRVIEAAAESDCRVVLFDTFQKSRGGLLDWLAVDELTQRIATIQNHGLKAAIAGSLSLMSLPELLPLGADIIGVRGAACQNGSRNAGICADAVRTIRLAIDAGCSSELRRSCADYA